VSRKDQRRPNPPSYSEHLLPGAIPLNYQVRHEFFSFSLPHFPGAPKSERPLLPRRAGALWEGPVVFGRSRESRTREAAGRRNWPEAVPREMRGGKRALIEISENRDKDQTAAKQLTQTIRNARPLWDRRVWRVALADTQPARLR
jgi:hypothetical protein